MKHVKKSVLLWYAPHEIYQVVTDVEAYPQFLPWCERVEVLERSPEGLTARLHLAYSGLRHAFTTRNVHVPDESVHIGLVDGPFSLLDGHWRFVALPVPGAAAGEALRESGLLERFADCGLEQQALGIWGRPCRPETPLRSGDRVELHRPLAMDPKEARRMRASPRPKRRR